MSMYAMRIVEKNGYKHGWMAITVPWFELYIQLARKVDVMWDKIKTIEWKQIGG